MSIQTHAAFLLAFVVPSAAAITSQWSVSENGLSHHHMVVQPTPKCWNAATQIFPEISPSIDTVQLCALLPEQDQKRLALEIARCHMLDLGKPLVHGPCHQLDDCLRNLTLEGANAYTHYITYVQQLCIRLTQELLLQQQHQIQVDIGEQYMSVSQETLAQVKSLQDSIAQHVRNMDELSELPQRLRDDLSRELQEKLSQTLSQSLDRELDKHLATQLEHQLELQLGSLLQQQALHQDIVDGILDNLTIRDQELQERFKLWEHYQTSLWSNHAMEVEKQRLQIEEQRHRMEYLSTTLMQATRSLWPLEGLKAGVKWLARSHAWLATGIHFLIHMLMIGITTRPLRCHAFRMYLFQFTILEALLEIVIRWMMVPNQVVGSETGVDAIISYVRMGFRLAAILLYLLGIISSCFPNTNLEESEMHAPDWEWTSPDPLLYYYHHPVPPMPRPVPFATTRERYEPPSHPPVRFYHDTRVNAPQVGPRLSRVIPNHPVRYRGDGGHNPFQYPSPTMIASPATTMLRAVVPTPTPAREIESSPDVLFKEEITPPPVSQFDHGDHDDHDDGDEEEELFHDAEDPDGSSDRKRKYFLFAEDDSEAFRMNKKIKK